MKKIVKSIILLDEKVIQTQLFKLGLAIFKKACYI